MFLVHFQACFDVREGPKMWQSFGELEEAQEGISIEWLSTHPSHENRERSLQDIVPEVSTKQSCQTQTSSLYYT